MGKLSVAVARKRTDFLVLVLLVAVALAASSMLAQNRLLGKALVGGAIFTLPGTLYLAWRAPKPWKKLLVSALVFGGLFGFFFDFIQEFTHSYEVVSRVFPKILGVVPPDNVLGHTMMALLTFTFYEHFVNKRPNRTISSHLRYAIYFGLIVIAVALGAYFFNPGWLEWRYPYLYFGTLAILPIAVHLYRHPEHTRDLALMVPFFFYLYMMIEIAAVRYSWWIYPGDNYIGWVWLGTLDFPFEELFFWMLFYAAALVTYYKIFIDRPSVAGGK